MLVAAAATGPPGPERDRRLDQRGECAVKNKRGGGRGAPAAASAPLSARSTDRAEDGRNNEMTSTKTSPELPIWPSGIARLAGGILEVTTGDGIRVATADIVKIGVAPPRAGRLSLDLVYRAGLDTVKTSFWVEPGHEVALRRLVDAVTETKRDA
jgi:hypothetical protein